MGKARKGNEKVPQVAGQDDPIIFADLGNFRVKVVSSAGNRTYLSAMGIVSRRQGFGEQIKRAIAFTRNGQQMVFGEDAYYISEGQPRAFNHQERYTDPFYSDLLASALWAVLSDRAGQGVIYPHIGINIPARDYQLGKAPAVVENLAGRYELTPIGGGEALIVEISPERIWPIPEGVGAYFNSLYAPGGERLAQQVIGFVDVGGLSINVGVMDKGVPIRSSLGTLYEYAGSHISVQIADELARTHGYQGTEYQIAEALEAGCIQIGAQCVSFVEFRDRVMLEAFNAHYRFFATKAKGTNPAGVLVAGGTGQDLYRLIGTEYRNQGWALAHEADDANAQGGYKALVKRIERQQAQ